MVRNALSTDEWKGTNVNKRLTKLSILDESMALLQQLVLIHFLNPLYFFQTTVKYPIWMVNELIKFILISFLSFLQQYFG